MIIDLMIFFLTTIISIFLFWRLWFLRDPKRNIPKSNDIIVSPADGKIIKILKINNKQKIKIDKGKFGKIFTLTNDTIKKGYLISIMMTVFDVHYQRCPVDGKVVLTKHTKGNFKNVVFGDKFYNGLENEKNEVIIKNPLFGKVKIIQIAGLIARRIDCFLKKEDKVKKGQYLGLINFGSQVSLIIPDTIKLKIKKGQSVLGGKTIIGEKI